MSGVDHSILRSLVPILANNLNLILYIVLIVGATFYQLFVMAKGRFLISNAERGLGLQVRSHVPVQCTCDRVPDTDIK